MNPRRVLLALCAAALAACAGAAAYRRPGAPAQKLPANIKSLALRTIVNKTQQSGLEDKLALALRDEFLRDGRYPLVPENEADGIVALTLTRYALSPISYDATLSPTNYKLRVAGELDMIDRAANKVIWHEPNVEASYTYPAAALTGGLSEESAREQIWTILAPTVVGRVIDGFGATAGSPPASAAPARR